MSEARAGVPLPQRPGMAAVPVVTAAVLLVMAAQVTQVETALCISIKAALLVKAPLVELAATDYGLAQKESSGVLDHLIRGGEFSLYGLANAVTRAAQDVESYDRSTAMESIGYTILGMSKAAWDRLQQPAPAKRNVA